MSRIGFVHIPKTAGTSVNKAIWSQLAIKPFHIRKVSPSNNLDSNLEQVSNPRINSLTVSLGSELFKEASRNMWIAGHISALDMQKFDREFVFSVLRDRPSRIISSYRYGRFRWEITGKVGIKPEISLEMWIKNSSRNIFRGEGLLIAPEFSKNLTRDELMKNHSDISKSFIAERLSKLDWIYFPSDAQEIVCDLHKKGLISKNIQIGRERETRNVYYRPSNERSVLDLLFQESIQKDLADSIFEIAQSRCGENWKGKKLSVREITEILRKHSLV